MTKVDIDGLSPQEIFDKHKSSIRLGVQIMPYVAQGLSDVEIASAMFLSHGAVKSRLKVLYHLIGARNRVHAVGICVAHGWLTREALRPALEARIFRNSNADGRSNITCQD